MSVQPKSLRSPLGRVRGRGASHSGTSSFIAQRATAIALAVLAPYLAIYAAQTIGPDYTSAALFVAKPWVAAPLVLLLIAGLYHMQIGMQVIIEDYIARPMSRTLLNMLNLFLVIALAVVGVLAVLKLFLGA